MILRDPVHGLVSFEGEEERCVVRLLGTPEVQRLRRIRQLGLTSLAYPGAEHTRFAHAIGAAHVMQLFVARLRRIDGELPFWQRLTSERARDAIAAALLHDLGHGPLSHLFEEALAYARPVRALGSQPGQVGLPEERRRTGSTEAGSLLERAHHEDWTEAILLDPSTGVGRVLRAEDSELPRRVAGLIRGRHELPYLARAVSGTFDVDRCDYLLRDAHATGVRYGELDLPWLLRSLCFAVSPHGEAPGLGIDGLKGLAAIEAFVMARLFMFQQVYFHKATRAAEWMLQVILRRALELLRDGTPLESVPAAFYAFAVGRQPTLGEYLALDDLTLLTAIDAWQGAADPILADLCRRLRARELFKTYELLGEAAAPDAAGRWLALARDVAVARGLDPEVYVGLDVAQDVPYGEDGSLDIVFPRGATRRPSEVSFVLGRLKDEPLRRVRLIFASELREAVHAVMQS
ncbi:MAG: HD domain-containing protein [Polyangiaceae bacterium]|nr:HD domain-containing protein [Polyangiaceae bacterium]